MSISVIIPANNPDSLSDCLEALANSETKPSEVIIVDDGSNPPIESGDYTLIRIDPKRGPAHARNIGAQHAQSEILCFLDSDVKVAPDTIGRLIRAMNQHLCAVQPVYTKSCPHPEFWTRYENLYQHFNFARIKDRYIQTFFTYCLAIRKKELLMAGGFDTSILNASVEDGNLGIDLALQGKRVLLDKQIKVQHLRRFTPWSLLRRRFIIGYEKAASMLKDKRRLRVNLRRTPHSPSKVISILLAPVILFHPYAALLGSITFIILNIGFLKLAYKEYGIGFSCRAICFYWIDCMAAILGLGMGVIAYTIRIK